VAVEVHRVAYLRRPRSGEVVQVLSLRVSGGEPDEPVGLYSGHDSEAVDVHQLGKRGAAGLEPDCDLRGRVTGGGQAKVAAEVSRQCCGKPGRPREAPVSVGQPRRATPPSGPVRGSTERTRLAYRGSRPKWLAEVSGSIRRAHAAGSLFVAPVGAGGVDVAGGQDLAGSQFDDGDAGRADDWRGFISLPRYRHPGVHAAGPGMPTLPPAPAWSSRDRDCGCSAPAPPYSSDSGGHRMLRFPCPPLHGPR
jgi:hypothetical protein